MTRRAARITHDEVVRMVKALQTCGIAIGRVSFDGEKVDVITVDHGDFLKHGVDDDDDDEGLILEPKL